MKTLYHGSIYAFETIDLSKGKGYKDFGRGFYATALKRHAESLAKRNKQIIDQKEDLIKRKIRLELLRELGVHTALYTNGSIVFPEHPDGVHYYIKDASDVQKLVMNGESLPDDLKESLLYYKSLNWLENQTGNDEGDD